jgi:hypothetical protein
MTTAGNEGATQNPMRWTVCWPDTMRHASEGEADVLSKCMLLTSKGSVGSGSKCGAGCSVKVYVLNDEMFCWQRKQG